VQALAFGAVHVRLDLVGLDVAPLLLALRGHPDAAGHGLAVAGEPNPPQLLAARRELRGLLADLLDVRDLDVDVAPERALDVVRHVLGVLVVGLLDDEDDVDRARRLRARAALGVGVVTLDEDVGDDRCDGAVPGEALEVDGHCLTKDRARRANCGVEGERRRSGRAGGRAGSSALRARGRPMSVGVRHRCDGPADGALRPVTAGRPFGQTWFPLDAGDLAPWPP
jgi:hypothetical protein